MKPSHSITSNELHRAADGEYILARAVAVPPRKRDAWRVLRGTYKPLVKIERTYTVAGMSRELKQAWSAPAVHAVLNDACLLFPDATASLRGDSA